MNHGGHGPIPVSYTHLDVYKRQPLRRNLEHCGLLRFFPEGTIFSAEDVVLGKPEPDLFLHAAVAMGFGPSACVVVEDSQHGVAAARAAGMRVVGYAGGITPARLLAGADVLVTDLTDVPELCLLYTSRCV